MNTSKDTVVPVFINVSDIEYVLKNAPTNTTFESAKNALEKMNSNLVESIAFLWNYEKPKNKL